MNQRIELTDELLAQALRARSDVELPAGLLSRVTAGATGLAQERARRRVIATPRFRLLPTVSAAAVAVALVVAVLQIRPFLQGPGSTPSPFPSPTAAPTPDARPTAAASAPAPSPEARLLGTASALRLRLGNDVAPIDVASAFDSIWIADIHANDVRRYDPATMRELARIPVPGGPAWFAVAGSALWVSTQNGTGLTRIDPETNTATAKVGDDAPCGAPVVMGGDIWQAACDADAFLQIDPTTATLRKRYPAEGHAFLVEAQGALYTTDASGISRWDPRDGTFTKLPKYAGGSDGLVVSDGETLWVAGATNVLRIDPADGHTLATFAFQGAVAITFDARGNGTGDAYITSGGAGVADVDLATNKVVRTVPVPGPWVARVGPGGVLWVTDFNDSVLWRVEP